jgi:hypothetical protein
MVAEVSHCAKVTRATEYASCIIAFPFRNVGPKHVSKVPNLVVKVPRLEKKILWEVEFKR